MLNIILGECVICYVCVSVIFFNYGKYLFFVVFHYNLQDKHLVFNHSVCFCIHGNMLCNNIKYIYSCFELSFC